MAVAGGTQAPAPVLSYHQQLVAELHTKQFVTLAAGVVLGVAKWAGIDIPSQVFDGLEGLAMLFLAGTSYMAGQSIAQVPPTTPKAGG